MINRRQLTLMLPAAFAAAPALAQSPNPPTSGKAGELRIGYQRGGTLLIAKQQGAIEARLKPLGIQVRWVEFSFGPPLLEALNVGSIDYGLTGDAPPIFAQAAKANMVYVAASDAGGSGSAILLPPGSTLRDLADLEGRRVGFARASSAHNLTIAALEKAGLSWSDIVPVQLPPADARGAFELDVEKAAIARADLEVGPVTSEVIAQQQATADAFNKLGLVPKRISVRDAVWSPPGQ